MVEDLREIVIEQGDVVNTYEQNIESAARRSGKAVGELVKTEQKTKYSNTKLVVFAIIVCLLLTLTWVIYAYT